jgi:hypothetical protein
MWKFEARVQVETSLYLELEYWRNHDKDIKLDLTNIHNIYSKRIFHFVRKIVTFKAMRTDFMVPTVQLGECTVHSVQCTVNSAQCSVYSLQCSVYSAVFSVQCTVHGVQCTVFLWSVVAVPPDCTVTSPKYTTALNFQRCECLTTLVLILFIIPCSATV